MFEPSQDKPFVASENMQKEEHTSYADENSYFCNGDLGNLSRLRNLNLQNTVKPCGTILSLISIKAGFRPVLFKRCHEGGEHPRRNHWLDYCNRYFGNIGLCRVLSSQLNDDLLPSECPLTTLPWEAHRRWWENFDLGATKQATMDKRPVARLTPYHGSSAYWTDLNRFWFSHDNLHAV
jgi:hypothetical protein